MLRSATLSAVALLLTVRAASAQNKIISVDGSSTVFPDYRSNGRGVPESQQGDQGTPPARHHGSDAKHRKYRSHHGRIS
jgi:hypothetical protein